VDACLAGAIDHEIQPELLSLNVGAIIMAPGFSAFDPSPFSQYHYANHPNVVTSLEFERLLSASGPFQGHMVRPSDHREPQKIAWLQCTGSRDINACDHSYCSSVCCMYAVKQTVIAKEHSPSPLDAAVFYMDMRTFGKEFDRYYLRAKNDSGVRFIRSRVHTVEDDGKDNLKLKYVTDAGELLEETFDMVVLSVGMVSGPQNLSLARTLDIKVNAHNFAATHDFFPVATSRPGIFVCGAFQGPKDIPQSVMEASAAAACASETLSSARGSLTRTRSLPPEIDVSGQEPRIGVFVCNCGINIGGVADVPAVRDFAATLPHVVHVEDNLFTCSQDTQDKIKQVIIDNRLNRVVVASCPPGPMNPCFRKPSGRQGSTNIFLKWPISGTRTPGST